MQEERQIFSLKQVASSIQKLIAERYQQTYWVQAEIHKLNYTGKGHCYPELVHKEDGKILAEMRGTIWATAYDRISRNFAAVVKEPLRDGLNLLLLVKINFHPLYGMGLEILDIDPNYSLGELQRERDESLKRLKQEGILNNNQLLPFPLLPKRIAIISVDSSKGLSDFYSVCNGNSWNYRFFFMLFPAQLNGDAAVDSIQNQLRRIEKVKAHFDLVLIIRGGGGEIGMSCYNNYELSRAIATFPLPIMTGIGHSTNITVAELVAFRSAITPTELAEFLIQAFHEFSVPLQEAKKSIQQKTISLVSLKKTELQAEIRFTLKLIENYFNREGVSLLNISRQIQQESKTKLTREAFLLKSGVQQIRNGIRNYRQQEEKKQADLILFLKQANVRYFDAKKSRFQQFEKSIHLVDPKEVLKRGYSLSLLNGKIISNSNPVKIGDTIEIQTAGQLIGGQVKTIKQQDHE